MKRPWTWSRHLTQIGILALFLASLSGWRGVTGTLSGSRILGITLADPLAVIQIFLARHNVAVTLALAALWILLAYWLVGGRTFCGWVCPINTLLEAVDVVRKRLKTPDYNLGTATKYWVLLTVLVLSLVTGLPVFELISPLGILLRNLLYGAGGSIAIILILVGFELFVSRRGFCRYLCPLGAFYGLVARMSPLQLCLNHRECTRCAKCTEVCPMGEEALQAGLNGKTDLINANECTKCGKCIEVCPTHAIRPGFVGSRLIKTKKTEIEI